MLHSIDASRAEQYAVALAITHTPSAFTALVPIIFTDSRPTCWRLTHNLLPHDINQDPQCNLHLSFEIVCIPDHNEGVNLFAWEILLQATIIFGSTQSNLTASLSLDPYRCSWHLFPVLHLHITHQQGPIIHKAQTDPSIPSQRPPVLRSHRSSPSMHTLRWLPEHLLYAVDIFHPPTPTVPYSTSPPIHRPTSSGHQLINLLSNNKV